MKHLLFTPPPPPPPPPPKPCPFSATILKQISNFNFTTKPHPLPAYLNHHRLTLEMEVGDGHLCGDIGTGGESHQGQVVVVRQGILYQTQLYWSFCIEEVPEPMIRQCQTVHLSHVTCRHMLIVSTCTCEHITTIVDEAIIIQSHTALIISHPSLPIPYPSLLFNK